MEPIMKRMIARATVAVVLLMLGWTIGVAQRRGDFELRIDASGGSTTVECVRGCRLVGWRDIENLRAAQLQRYMFTCSPPAERCAGRVVGFIKP
jgi:hypothetical protein